MHRTRSSLARACDAAKVSPPRYADRKEFNFPETKKALRIRILLTDRDDAARASTWQRLCDGPVEWR